MQGKGKSIYMNRAQHDLKRRRQLRNWAILIAVVVAVFVADVYKRQRWHAWALKTCRRSC